MRYTKQRTLSECGPRAIYNAFVWAGRNPVSMEKLKLQCKTTRYGTSDYNVGLVLRRYFSVKRITLAQLMKLKEGEAVLLSYCRKEGSELSGHFVFIEKKEDDQFLIVNHISHKNFDTVTKDTGYLFETTKKVSSKFLKRFLKPQKINGYYHPVEIMKVK